MKAVRINEHGGYEVLKIVNLPDPAPGNRQVLVKIKAAAMNHLDIWVRRGFPGVPLPIIPGCDGSGEVVALGEGVKSFKPGDPVVIQPQVYCGKCRECQRKRENFCEQFGIFGETQDGTCCELMAVDEKYLYPKPENLSFEEAAAFPLVSMTAYTMLIRRAQLTREESVLIWGAGSGVGHIAVQVAKSIGCQVIATAGSQEKLDMAAGLGADILINHHDENVFEIVRDAVGKRGVDVVFEHVGAATWGTSSRLLAKGGRIVTCGATTGPKVEIDLRHIFYKQQSIIGSTMGDVSSFTEILKLVENGTVKPIVSDVFKMEDIGAAHEFMERGGQFGKIVISI